MFRRLRRRIRRPVLLTAVLTLVLTGCPENPGGPDASLFPESEALVLSTISAGADSTSAMVSSTLNAAGAVYDEPYDQVWSGDIYCQIDTDQHAKGATEDRIEVEITVTPLDPQGGRLAEAAKRGRYCGIARAKPPNPVPCQPEEACTRSWEVTFHRPPGVEGEIRIQWDYVLFVDYDTYPLGLLEEIPSGAKLTKTITGAEPVPEPTPGSPSPKSP